MQIRADFSVPEFLGPGEPEFVASPMAGVERRMLDRIGTEVARATSIVRYAPASRFSTHHHELGEEYLVLSGVFSDEDGDAPAGFYVRNPPGSGHAPWSAEGCEIFVKLRQFDSRDLESVRVNTFDPAMYVDGQASGILRAMLHVFGSEKVFMEHWKAGTIRQLGDPRGAEMLVVSGTISCAGRIFGPHGWVRLPPGAHTGFTAESDSHVWIKTGHLPV